jgi:hypothetical protein
MSIIYRFPTNVSVDDATQEYFIEREKLLGDKIMPFVERWTQRVQWDELDNESGMTAPHKLKTDRRVGTRPGRRKREYKPIYFKETDVIGEDELLEEEQAGTLGGVVDMHELIGRTIKTREDKNFLRAEYLRWQALRGEININENGVRVHETFPVQTYQVDIDWRSSATATPLRDDNAVSLMFRGTGASGKGAIAYLNKTTLNWKLQNANPADLQNFRAENFRNVTFSLADLNKIQRDRELPEYELYDEGYYETATTYKTFIEDGEVIVIGKRPAGQPVGDIAMTPSLHRQKNGKSAPGMFTIVEVNGQKNVGSIEVSLADLGASKNPKVEVTGGFYGGPRIKFPRSVIRMRVKVGA